MVAMRLYASLSKLKYLDKNYSFKYLFIAFLGIHIPLIGIIVFALISGFKTFSPLVVIECTLAFTLIACAITLWMQNALAQPIIITKNALNEYLIHKVLPTLPTNFKDEVGLLMSNTSIALNELDCLIKDKRDFIYLLSHDLKTPLHNVITLAQLMKDDERNESKEEYLQLIKQSTSQQIQLISTVLNLATSEFGCQANIHAIALEPLINKITNDMAVNLKNKELTVLVDIPSTIMVNVNEELFTMAISNLVTNAIKFSKRDSEIMLRAVEMADYIMIRVIDYGIGFMPGYAPNFEPFTKAGRTGTAGEASSGLGLYFTKKIIAYHGGSLTAESEGEGKGAKFIVKVPKVAASASAKVAA